MSNMEPVGDSMGFGSKGFQVIEWHMLDVAKYLRLNTASSFTIRTLTYPLTVVKTRMQVEPSIYAEMGTLGTFRHILANEGSRALYRGFLPNSLQMTSVMTYLMLYEKIREKLAKHDVANSHLRAFIAGAGATAGAQLILVPLDVVSQHMMVSHILSKKHPVSVDASILKSPLNLSEKYKDAKGPLSYFICKEIYKRDGILRGFYRGYFASLLCYAPSSAVFWSTYHALSDYICKKVDSVPQIVVTGVSATVASLTATVLTHSLDVFRTNLQIERLATDMKLGVRGTKWRETMSNLWQKERFGIFTMGLTARSGSRSVWRLSFFSAVKPLQVDLSTTVAASSGADATSARARLASAVRLVVVFNILLPFEVTMGCVPSRQFDSNAKSHSFSVTAKLSSGRTVRGSIEIGSFGIRFHQRTALIIQCPWHHVRCYGFCDDFFRFESGRRCEFGPGVYTFQCSRASELFCQVQRIIFETATSAAYNEADRFDAYNASSSIQRFTSSDFFGNRADFSRANRASRFGNCNTIRLMNDFSEFSELHIPTQRNACFVDLRSNAAAPSTNSQSHYINVHPLNQAANPVEQVVNQDRRRFFQFLGRSGSSRSKSKNAERPTPAPPPPAAAAGAATLMPAALEPIRALVAPTATVPEPEPTPLPLTCSLSDGGNGEQQNLAVAKAEDQAYDMSQLNYVTLEMGSSASSSSNLQTPTTSRTFGDAATGAGTSSTNYAVIDSTKTKALHHTTSTLHSRSSDEFKALRRGRFASSTDSYGR
ncbi:Solute carrier family 25 member 44 [Trichinella britovi]|uniref:Solute carrier family 25 member 44 n=1 Tax=Trichinella britovi TaxID=45882 RepID=A0A0V1D442_TRIBR|nr:Solute carrier family 25 member 44 [Trichinella britovi]